MFNKKIFLLAFVIILLSSNIFAFADEDELFNTQQEGQTTTETTEQNPVVNPEINQNPEITTTVNTPQVSNTGKTFVLTIGSKIVKTNNGDITLPNSAEVIDGRLYLPLRFVSENVLGISPVFNKATSEIILAKDGKEIKLYIGKKEAIINGTKTVIENEPLSKNNTTLLPVKFFTQYFTLNLKYDPTAKTVTITEEAKDANPPTAAFELSKTEFVQGEPATFIDKSSDIDGDTIIKGEFRIKETNISKPDLSSLIKETPEGTFTLQYRVMNNKNVWSTYTEQVISVIKNQPPQILNLRVTKSNIARGEEFDIVFEQKNEDWEQIIESNWTYRYENQDESKAKKGKPNRFFTEGNYIVTLQLKDSVGNLSNIETINIKVGARVVQTQMQYLAEADITNTSLENYNNTNYLEMFKPIEDIVPVDNNKILIMSDSPENVFSYGILYEDVVEATEGRLLTYHVNKLSLDKSAGAGVVVIAQNLDANDIVFSLEQTGMKGPSTDPHEVGGKVLETHFRAESPWKDFYIPAMTSKIIYDSRVHLNWKPNNLISMLSEFRTSGRTKITIASVGPTTKLEHIPLLPYLERDQHPRGTFNVTERLVAINTPRWDAMSVILGKNDQEWVVGNDGVTKLTTVNKGNYGVEYKVTITPKEETIVVLNCRGGAWRGFIGWNNGVKKSIVSLGPHDARYIGKLEANKPSTIRYMLPNGSASPVQLGFLPKSVWHR